MIPRDEIVSIAREAGFAQSWSEAAGEALERFAALVAAKVIARTPPPPLVVSMSDVDQAKLAAMLAKRQPMPMVAAPDDSELAACFDQIKSDLIADGAVEHDLRLEFFPEAVLDAFRRQLAARIESQQRLADAQELLAKSGLAHRKAVQAAVSEAVAEEREACAALCESWNTAMTDNLAEAIRARGAQPTTPPPIPPSPANP